MPSFDRRQFLSTSAGTLAALSLGSATAPLLADDALEQPTSLFLTWWTDPTTTMVIQWVGPETADTPIRYTEYNGDTWKRMRISTSTFPDTDLKVHRCELTGLKPDTEYKFQIGRVLKHYRFRTMPAKATNTIQFVSGGDCGTGSHAIGTNKMAAAQEPHFALIGGDLAYDNGNSPKTFLQFLQNYSQHMIDPRGRLIPMITCPGNHECNGRSPDMHVSAPHYLSVFNGLFRDTSYGVMDFGDYLSIVLLDTGHLQPVKGAQTSWLQSTLGARQDRAHLLVANHVPAYPSVRAPEDTGKENRKYWCPLFEKYNVDVVLEHHDHAFKRTFPMKDGMKNANGIRYLGDGSWGQIRTLNKPENRPFLEKYGSAYHVSVHRLEGDMRYHIALEESGRVADVCTTFGKRPAKRG